MFSRILVPLDGSPLAECVLPHVVAMARPFGATVDLLTVCEPTPSNLKSGPVNVVDWSLRTAEADAYLDKVRERLRDVGLKATARRVEGKPAEQILASARRNGHDLIVLSSHGRSGLSGWNISSVVQKVVIRARRSVMLVRAYQPGREQLDGLSYTRILCPQDCSLRAEHALPAASALARAHNAELVLAHAVVRPEMPRCRPLDDAEREARTAVVELNRKQAEHGLGRLQSELQAEGVQARTRIVVGDSQVEAIHDVIDQEQVDLVAMTAHGQTGSSRWPYGTLALHLIVFGTAPLLIDQDVAPEDIRRTQAEVVAQETTGH